jgi:hypothetical protein
VQICTPLMERRVAPKSLAEFKIMALTTLSIAR